MHTFVQLNTNNLGQCFTASFSLNESLHKHTPTRSPWSQYQIRNVPSHNENQISQNLRSPPCLHVVVLINWLWLFLWTFHTEKIIAGRWKSHNPPRNRSSVTSIHAQRVLILRRRFLSKRHKILITPILFFIQSCTDACHYLLEAILRSYFTSADSELLIFRC